jgi:hypothetical protein
VPASQFLREQGVGLEARRTAPLVCLGDEVIAIAARDGASAADDDGTEGQAWHVAAPHGARPAGSAEGPQPLWLTLTRAGR